MFNFSDTNKIGMGLVLISLVSFFCSVMFLLDRSLALLANITFFVGIYFLLGFAKLFRFFTSKEKLKGSCYLFLGFVLIFLHLSLFGIPVQLVGLFYIFRSFFPHLFEWSMSFPVVGPWLSWLIRKQSIVRKSLQKGGWLCEKLDLTLTDFSFDFLFGKSKERN